MDKEFQVIAKNIKYLREKRGYIQGCLGFYERLTVLNKTE